MPHNPGRSLSRRPSRRCERVLVAAVAAAVLITTAAASPAPAAHCVLTLNGSDAPTARCGAAAETPAARAGTLLMTWYREPDYGGDSTDLRSTRGPCDAAGYGVPTISRTLGWVWNDTVSSFRAYAGCTVIEGFANSDYGGRSHTWIGDTRYVGDDWNDRISSFLVHGETTSAAPGQEDKVNCPRTRY